MFFLGSSLAHVEPKLQLFEVWEMMVRQIIIASIAMVINQVSLAEAASTTSASLDRPPPRPLRLLPSPPPKSGRRQVMALARMDAPTFSTLNAQCAV